MALDNPALDRPGRAAPSALEGDERLFQNVVESAPYAMLLARSNGTIVLVNAEAERLFG